MRSAVLLALVAPACASPSLTPPRRPTSPALRPLPRSSADSVRRLRGGDDGPVAGLQRAYLGVPVATRSWLSAVLGLAALSQAGLVSEEVLAVDAAAFSGRLQLWRPLTAAAFVGGVGPQLLQKLYYGISFGRELERELGTPEFLRASLSVVASLTLVCHVRRRRRRNRRRRRCLPLAFSSHHPLPAPPPPRTQAHGRDAGARLAAFGRRPHHGRHAPRLLAGEACPSPSPPLICRLAPPSPPLPRRLPARGLAPTAPAAPPPRRRRLRTRRARSRCTGWRSRTSTCPSPSWPCRTSSRSRRRGPASQTPQEPSRTRPAACPQVPWVDIAGLFVGYVHYLLNDNLKPDEAVPTLLKEKGRAADAKAARAAGAKGGGGGGKPGDRRRKARIVTVGAGASCGAGG